MLVLLPLLPLSVSHLLLLYTMGPCKLLCCKLLWVPNVGAEWFLFLRHLVAWLMHLPIHSCCVPVYALRGSRLLSLFLMLLLVLLLTAVQHNLRAR